MGCAMTVYRLYCLASDGRIEAAVEVEAVSDANAIKQATLMHPNNDCELWQLDRLVSKIPKMSSGRSRHRRC
jgi:hypothetical protein